MAFAVALLLVPALGGCGLHPLYAGGGNGAVARGLASVEVAPIEGRNGWLMRNALVDRLGAPNASAGAARYRLDVRLDDRIEGFALLANDNVAGAIIGASRPEQVADNVKASGVTLDEDVLRRIDEVLGDLPETDGAKTASPQQRPA